MTDFVLPSGALLRKAQSIARAAHKEGGRALLVGGWVRDALSGQNPKDADLEVFGVAPENLQKLLRPFGKVNCVGESFRVLKLSWREDQEHLELDVSIPRRDRKTGEGHRGFEIEGDPHASFEDAARRRDFTINAIGCDPLTSEILDPFSGREDLGNKILRAVDANHFGEDSLRVLRAMQFAARFDLTIEQSTVEICRATPLNDLPRERLWMEWEKLLLRAARPSQGIIAARELGILSRLFPPLYRNFGVEMLCYPDCAARVRESVPPQKRVALMLAALVMTGGEQLAKSFLDAVGVYSQDGFDVRATTIKLVRETSTVEFNPIWTDSALRRLSCRCDLGLFAILLDCKGHDTSDLRAQIKKLDIENGPPAPLLLGRHVLELGVAPGKRIGEITRAVYEKQLDGEVESLESAIEMARAMVN